MAASGKARRVCLITPAHLSGNPRLVKEADALTEAGYDVQVFACQYVDWLAEADKELLHRAKWRTSILCWKAGHRPYLFWKSRVRQHACRRLLKLFWRNHISNGNEKIALRAFDRVLPELLRSILKYRADLYIAHNIQALPIAVIAAQKFQAKVGFDAEDFHSGISYSRPQPAQDDKIAEYLERKYLPLCDYLTAASPGIADAYVNKYGCPRPLTILNVFPLAQRPEKFRLSNRSRPLTLYWFSQTIGAGRGLEDVIRAMGLLGDNQMELHLRGAWQAGYKERLFKFAAECGVEHGRIIIHNPAAADEMVRLGAEYDIGLALEQAISLNSDICLSNKIFTYFAAGSAVIATATKGQQSVMGRVGKAGFCYEAGDIDGLARQLNCWAENRSSLEESRLHAWDWATQEYNWDLEKQKFLRVVGEAFIGTGG